MYFLAAGGTAGDVDDFPVLDGHDAGGNAILAGSLLVDEPVVTVCALGNRDEDVFSNPDRLVLDRTEPRLLSFGSGIHHCIGFRLARMQLTHMWEGILDRFSGFELLDEPTRLRSNFVQGYLSMPVIARA